MTTVVRKFTHNNMTFIVGGVKCADCGMHLDLQPQTQAMNGQLLLELIADIAFQAKLDACAAALREEMGLPA